MKRLGPGVTTLGMLAIAASLAAGRLCRSSGACGADLPAPAPGYYPPAYLRPRSMTGPASTSAAISGQLLADSVSQNGVSASGTNFANAIGIPKAGVVGGGQIGLNYQFASWVVGAEASVSATNISGSGNELTSIPNTIRMTSAPMDFAAVTGRVGYAFNTLLFYAKAGGGTMQVHYTQDTLIPAGTSATPGNQGHPHRLHRRPRPRIRPDRERFGQARIRSLRLRHQELQFHDHAGVDPVLPARPRIRAELPLQLGALISGNTSGAPWKKARVLTTFAGHERASRPASFRQETR